MKAPGFWTERNALAWLFYPVSLVYGRISLARFKKEARYKAHMPVLCIGNLVMGGAGKTPTALTLGRMAKSQHLTPIFLTRGFKGQEAGPLLVDPQTHSIADVGDEALLLARVAPTIVSRDRVAGAKLAEEISGGKEGSIIIMDDGFQNPYLHKDFNLIIVDSQQGLGNGFVFPAGPLRAPLHPQVWRADQFVIVGEGDKAPTLHQLFSRLGKGAVSACLQPDKCSLLGGTRVFAFCGIGQPEKFYRTLSQLDLAVIDHINFDDHHSFSREEGQEILDRADAQNLEIVTTAKDHVRLAELGDIGTQLAQKAHVIEVDMCFEDKGFAARVLGEVLRKFSRR
ncbi:tetraacyldisaccharide 4'-kinase [uncultured Cohaesibacter sp.]|uniref:tetraacyldisaccharide 4'-kinase n=1 Tax=uncultured Cohaesibacter sp. TaxID=1002546 RepID=UPI002AA71C86|nr:tetraacyldisaccharide 4'-kinase [uncultured Cohaesibacter sp.]